MNIPPLNREAIEEALLFTNDRLTLDYSFCGKRVCVSSVGTDNKKIYKEILKDLGAKPVETIRGELSPDKYADAIIIRQPDFDVKATTKRDDAILRQKEDPDFCVFSELTFRKYLEALDAQQKVAPPKRPIPTGKAKPTHKK